MIAHFHPGGNSRFWEEREYFIAEILQITGEMPVPSWIIRNKPLTTVINQKAVLDI